MDKTREGTGFNPQGGARDETEPRTRVVTPGDIGRRSYGRVGSIPEMMEVIKRASPEQLPRVKPAEAWESDLLGDYHRRIRRSRSASRRTGPPQPALVILPLYNGDSCELEGFLGSRTAEFDAASGTAVHLVSLGHPGQSGPIFRQWARRAFGATWSTCEEEYVRQIFGRGLDQTLRIEAMRNFAAVLGIPQRDLACFAVPTPGDGPRAIWKRIPPEWYETAEAQRQFSAAVQEWLAGSLLGSVIKLPVGSEEWRQGVSNSLEALFQRTSELLAAARERRERIGSTPGEGWASSPEAALLALTESTQQARYKRQPLPLTPVEFSILWHLAERPRTLVPYGVLLEAAGEFANPSDPSQWARSHKSRILRKLRGLVGSGGIMQDEVERLFRTKNRAIALQLPKASLYLEKSS